MHSTCLNTGAGRGLQRSESRSVSAHSVSRYAVTDFSEAFKYISKDYINHNPAAQNGSDSAWNILSPIWESQNITPIGTSFKYPQSWLNYRTGSFGEVVDRYRWEGGCIVEHVST
jgi:predicted SnoaL-like aldol condensation-catalyzing enzyme